MSNKKSPPKPTSRAHASKGLRILIGSGVNLDLLGVREVDIYGKGTLATLEKSLAQAAAVFAAALKIPPCDLVFFQTNDEATFLAKLSDGFDGAVLNPGAWTHTSLALADRLVGLALPFVEVHISNLAARESFRAVSYAAPHALGVVHGFGIESYEVGLWALLRKLAGVALPEVR